MTLKYFGLLFLILLLLAGCTGVSIKIPLKDDPIIYSTEKEADQTISTEKEADQTISTEKEKSNSFLKALENISSSLKNVNKD